MDTSQLRLCMFAGLRHLDTGDRPSQWVSLLGEVAYQAGQLGFMPKTDRRGATLDAPDREKAREVFWSLIVQGVIFPGGDQHNENLPWFALTEYGRTVVSSPDPVPHDPDRYLEHVADLAPNIDEIASSYLEEGLECFQRGVYRASLVMLGVASEKMMLDLAEAIAGSIPEAEATKLRNVIERRRISAIYEATMKLLQPRLKLKQLPRALSDGLEAQLNGVFTVIRVHRNEAGHPTGRVVDQITALGLYSSFPYYCQRWSQLVEHLGKHGFAEAV